MAMIKCSECGNDMSDKAKTCPTCGYKNKLYAKQQLKKLLIPIVPAIIVIGLLIGLLLRDTSAQDYLNAVDSGDYKLAESIYLEKVEGHAKAETNFSKKIKEHTQKLLQDYENDISEYDDIIQLLETYKACTILKDNITSDITELNKIAVEKTNQLIENTIYGYKTSTLDFESALSILDQITIPKTLDGLLDINESKQTIQLLRKERNIFKSGEEYIKKNNYVKALDVWNKLSDESIENFGINDIVAGQSESFKKDFFDKSYEAASAESYTTAIDLLLTLNNYLDDQAISNKIDEYKHSYTELLFSQVQEKLDNFQFQTALDILDDASDHYTDISIVKEKRSEILQQKNIYNETRIAELKNKISFAYDTIDMNYNIVPKGNSTEYINISRTSCVSPEIQFSNSEPILFLTLGFEKNDWVFMRKIQFSFDDAKTLTFSIGAFDTQTQVFWGGISEWYTLVHSTDFSTGKIDDLTDLFLSVSNANKTIIRFSGNSGRGDYEHTMTASEKQDMMIMWEVYGLLSDNPDLISILTN